MATIQNIWFKLLLTIAFFSTCAPSHLVAQASISSCIISIAQNQIGVKEATGKNDGTEVSAYLAYVGLGTGYDWCAAFVSWCYGNCGAMNPKNAWSPALFPSSKIVEKSEALPADVFGIWNTNKKRIAHVGLLERKSASYWITIEGNSNNAVERRRRHIKTIYRIANWLQQ